MKTLTTFQALPVGATFLTMNRAKFTKISSTTARGAALGGHYNMPFGERVRPV